MGYSVTVQVVDRYGNLVPTDSRLVKFEVSGAGEFLATAMAILQACCYSRCSRRGWCSD